MNDLTLNKSIYLKAEPAKVWDYLTNPEKLALWFHAPKAPLQQGKPLEMFGTTSGDKLIWGEVRVARAPEYLEYTFTIKPMGDAVSLVKWTLTPVAGGTRLELEHSGLPQHAEAFDLILALDKGWDDHIARMRAAATGDYRATITVSASPDQARKAILEEMHLWWSDRVEPRDNGAKIMFNNSHVDFEFSQGDTAYELNWNCRDANMIIEDVADTTEWAGTRLRWQIAPLPAGSEVTLIHEGLNANLDCQDVCVRGWQHYFETSLRDHLSGEVPSPQTH